MRCLVLCELKTGLTGDYAFIIRLGALEMFGI